MKAIILENIRSLNNVWAIIRTADGAGFDRVVMIGYTPTPPRREISKTALWAELSVVWEYFSTTHDAILHYKNRENCTIISLEKNNKSISLWELNREEKVLQNICLIVWNELDWVSETAQSLSDSICHLPMKWKKESLNVAVASGIWMYFFV